MSNNTVKSSEEASPSDTRMNKTLLNSMYRRRMSCPQAVQQLWDAVKVIRYQRQVPSLERIVKYMHRLHTVPEEEVQRQLGYCVRDGLLLVTKRMGSKGSKMGVEQEGYKLPDTEAVESDEHDWYCWECHTGGDVICCGGCNRVYHLSCINNLPGTKQRYLCHVCQACEAEENLNMKQSRLNRMLGMTCHTLKDRESDNGDGFCLLNITSYNFLLNSSEMLQRSINIGTPGAQIDIGAEGWRTKYLVHRNMDIARMASNAKERQYTHLAQFTADAHTVVHNVVIFHGVHSDQADRARQMLRDCLSEVSQIEACHSCYAAATTRPTRHWFCLPCRPPHPLVYAKAKQAPYWPAKVIKIEGDRYDVRFFGGVHSRAVVDKSCIQPITTNPNTLQVKRSPSWSKACEELKRHQEILNKDVDSSSSSDGEESVKSARSSKEAARVEERFGGESSSGGEEGKKPAVKRRRGRPPGKSPAKPPPAPASASAPPAITPPPVKKKRGRPPLKKPAVEEVVAKVEAEEEEESAEPPAPEPSPRPEAAAAAACAALLPLKEEETRPESPTTSTAPKSPQLKKEEEEIVSSSCMEPQFRSCGTQTKNDVKKPNKEIITKLTLELEELKTSHAEQIKQMQQSHLQEIASAKKKQWCYNCEQEAIYHCCWNTAYCSTECQQVHWQREHKRVCRRKR